jgi:hypothetical protein
MNAWLPPLNLIGVSTTWTSDLRTARSVMAEAAKRWAAERGFAV